MPYKVKVVSQTNAILLFITLLVVILVSSGLLLPLGGLQNRVLSILAVSVVATIIYVLWQIFVTGQTIWTIDDNEIKIVWTKKFFLANGTDVILKWSEIEDIIRGVDPHYHNLKIRLVSGDTIKYFHDPMTIRDDFKELVEALHQTLEYKKYIANKNITENR